MSTVRIPPVPLSKSEGSFGRHTETPRKPSTSAGSFGAQIEQPAIPTSSTVNGVTHIVPPGANEPR